MICRYPTDQAAARDDVARQDGDRQDCLGPPDEPRRMLLPQNEQAGNHNIGAKNESSLNDL